MEISSLESKFIKKHDTKKPKDTYDILFPHLSCNKSNIDRFEDTEKIMENPIFLP